MAMLNLNNAVIPASCLLASGRAAQAALAHANDVTRIAQSAELLGAAQPAIDITLDYARNRVQFGKPTGPFQKLQPRLVDAYIQLELCKFYIQSALTVIA